MIEKSYFRLYLDFLPFLDPLKILLIFQHINLLNLKHERKVGMLNGSQILTQRSRISRYFNIFYINISQNDKYFYRNPENPLWPS